ncbi:HEAT repeat-containing protein 3 [Lepisosteus oculatus]|uniref:HEAT repeat-containing protein 3 n=1 Tax=Lepisosteus oculatus TaxID=7918 RepID=UPI0035F513B2
MGKSKNKKFKRPQFSAEGLPVRIGQEEVEEDGEAGEVDTPAGELLDKLQNPSPDVREYTCASISRMVQQSQVIPAFLQRDAVRCLGPLLLDRSLSVRETAAGALRNLSACGGFEVCEDMVRQDVMTPLTSLLRECCAGFDSSSAPSPDPDRDRRNSLEAVAIEAVNLLWNLCESCSQAVAVFNKQGLLEVLMRCLETHPHNVELAVSAAYCLQTVTEENPELQAAVTPAVLQGLESVLLSSQQTLRHALLRTLAAGSVWNMKSALPSAQQAQTLNAIIATLSASLELDSGQHILKLQEAEARRRKGTTDGGEMDMQVPQSPTEEEMEEEELMKKKKPAWKKDDISDLLPAEHEELKEATALLSAQQTSLEIIVNMCCSDDPSDDEWEELSSSDESDLCVSDCNSSQLFSPLCLSAEVHSALLNHQLPEKVLKKTEFPSSAAVEACSKSPAWKGLVKRMHRVQCRALTCLHNMLSAMEAETLGGVASLQGLAEHLSKLVFSKPEIPKQDEFLEAITSALRSLLQILAAKNIPQCMTPQQLMSLSEAATQCGTVSVRINSMAILGITGSMLAREEGTSASLQMIGNFLLQVASKDPSLVVCGEALDALFDVFADGPEAERAAKEIRLLPALSALQPVFKAKLRKEGKGSCSPDQLCVLDNIKINLRRFIRYQESLEKNCAS